jgi:L-fuculose-phosphate aldolase
MCDEDEMRRKICEIGRRMYDKGFVAANDGNISYRLGEGRFLCTPTGVSKGFMKPEDLPVVDSAGEQISGPIRRTVEVLLHLTIYDALPEANAVAHCHAPHATAFAASGMALPSAVLPEVEVLLGPVPTVGYDNPGSESISKAVRPHLKHGVNTILLANHGPVGFDKTLELAFYHLETIDMYCRMLMLIKQFGSIQRLSEKKVRQLLAAKQRMGLDDPRLHGAEVYPPAEENEYLRHFLERGTLRDAPEL